ncbi:MAG: DinB family protein [Dehalococcoidia bacterium]|nr:DinB family protein [Dehalococcoidia bacterium]
MADFALQRQASLNLLRRIAVPEWDREGRHEVNGRLTVADWVEHWAEHDAEHIRQLELALGETLGDVKARRAQMVEDAQQS